MVCHETYRDVDGRWLFPADVRPGDGGAFVHAETGKPVERGRSEKMSKSKKNVVDPEAIIGAYGADTARIYMMSDSPPERDLEWTEAGIEGAWRYVNRLWRMFTEGEAAVAPPGTAKPAALGDAAEKAYRATNRTIADVSNDLDKFHFNRAVARVRELTNLLDGLTGQDADTAWVRRFGLDTVAQLIAPVMPHLAEELWQQLGHATLLAETPWPGFDEALIAAESVTVAVQVNGKLRGKIVLPPDAAEADAESEALALENVQRAIAGRTPRKVIVVPNKVINVVV
jgi:leucyl-tRNA synthetase